MKNLKFYLCALSLCALSFSFNSCDKDDDNTSDAPEMKGGDITGSWAYDENKSKNLINGEDAESYIAQLMEGMLNESEDLNGLNTEDDESSSGLLSDFGDLDPEELASFLPEGSDTITFLSNGTFSAGEVSGKYETNGNNLSITYTDEKGKEFTAKGGVDYSDLIAETVPELKDAVSVKINSIQYSVTGNTLAIKAVMVVTYDLSSFMSEEELKLAKENGVNMGKTTLNVVSTSAFNKIQ